MRGGRGRGAQTAPSRRCPLRWFRLNGDVMTAGGCGDCGAPPHPLSVLCGFTRAPLRRLSDGTLRLSVRAVAVCEDRRVTCDSIKVLDSMLLVSSFSARLDTHFEGYCFNGADYIAEFAGYAWFRQATGRDVGPGLDGCYTVARWIGETYEIGGDSRGLGKLFLYQAGNEWAVGSSLHGLVRYLRENGKELTPRPIIFDAFLLPGTFAQQLMSTYTMFKEINLVPSNVCLTVTAGTLRRRRVHTRHETSSYDEALATYVATWKSRARALLQDERARFAVDLSGGLDSRVGFSFVVGSKSYTPGDQRFRFVSNVGANQDFAIAQQVADQCGISLNGPRLDRNRPGSSAEVALERWREYCLGTYTPVYFHTQTFDPLHVKVHGAGGEAFRFRYNSPTLRDRMRPYQAHLERKRYRELVDLVSRGNRFVENSRPRIHPLSAQFREFRNRFHFGYGPHARATFSPLNSGLLDAVTDRDGVDPIAVYHDIFDSLVPGVKMIPFDNPTKAPRVAEVSTAARDASEAPVSEGSVYAIEDAVQGASRQGGNPYREWLEGARRVLADVDLTDIFDATQVQEFNDHLRECESQLPKRPAPNSQELRSLSVVITAGFALNGS